MSQTNLLCMILDIFNIVKGRCFFVYIAFSVAIRSSQELGIVELAISCFEVSVLGHLILFS